MDNYQLTGFFLVVFVFALPAELFKDTACTEVEDTSGKLLGARIADDGHWRFYEPVSIPE